MGRKRRQLSIFLFAVVMILAAFAWLGLLGWGFFTFSRWLINSAANAWSLLRL
jgi:hypothetical protein